MTTSTGIANPIPALAPEAVVVGRREHARLDGTDPGAPVELVGPAHRLDAPAWLAEAGLPALLVAHDGATVRVAGWPEAPSP